MNVEIDKDFVKQEVLTIPGMREAIRENNFDKAFELCRSVKKRQQLAMSLYIAKVDFMPYITKIPDSLFRGFQNLDELTIPGNIKEIGDLAFFGTPVSKLEIAEGVEKIGDGAFAQTKLREVHLPQSVKELGQNSLGRAKVFCFLTQEQIARDNGGKGYNSTSNDIINVETNEVIKPKF
ncbi:MAG: leucine-rich repeat protein [Methanobrevibacter sp.]|nr:leucine-rich repeat protein [Methanobrevibacter sp.]